MKLWKVTVNNWGWNKPCTLYFTSKNEAEEARCHYPAADDVEYAGNFSDVNAILKLPQEKAIELFGFQKVSQVLNKY